jgi:hypothetical protein
LGLTLGDEEIADVSLATFYVFFSLRGDWKFRASLAIPTNGVRTWCPNY